MLECVRSFGRNGVLALQVISDVAGFDAKTGFCAENQHIACVVLTHAGVYVNDCGLEVGDDWFKCRYGASANLVLWYT